MKLKQEIIKSGILGTDRYVPQNTNEIPTYFEKVNQHQDDKEDAFFKLAVATFLYEEMGFMGDDVSEEIPVCTSETKSYVSDQIISQMQNMLETNDHVIFNYFVTLCQQKKQIVPANFVTTILNQALSDKENQNEFLQLCGERGKWLCQLNSQWSKLLNQLVADDLENVWELGSLASRKEYFSQLRNTNPQEAIDLLAKSIQKEKADVRAEFLELLEPNLSLIDEQFLLTFLKDRSSYVKEAAYELLAQIQGSALNQSYANHILEALQLVEKDDKKSFKIDKKVIPSDEIFASGIDKVSSERGLQDHVYHFIQMIKYINPSILTTHYQIDEIELFDLLFAIKKVTTHQLRKIASTFKNKQWAKKILFEQDEYYALDLLRLFTFSEVETFFNDEKMIINLDSFISFFIQQSESNEFTERLSSKIIENLLKTDDYLNKSQLQRLGLKLSISMIDVLDKNIITVDKELIKLQESVNDTDTQTKRREKQNAISKKENLKRKYFEILKALRIKKQFN